MTVRPRKRRYVLLVMDGAADRLRIDGRSPLAAAMTPSLDLVAQLGASGLMKTLYDDLPQESLVAHLGMLGWDPHRYYPGGRASSELAAVPGVTLLPGDVVFRANLARIEDGVLRSYSAHSIATESALSLVQRVDKALRPRFAGFELYHVDDFRTLLVVRAAHVAPSSVSCAEPHAVEGQPIDVRELVRAIDNASRPFVGRVNTYLRCAAEELVGEIANSLLPWGLSTAFCLPPFRFITGFQGPTAIVGAMAFLAGICAAGGIDHFSVGNGRPDSDFAAKGRTVVELLESGYEFICCHANGPDEASHLHDPPLKTACLERIDRELVRPVVEWLRDHRAEQGGLVVTADHYSNSAPSMVGQRRSDIHSSEPVPFAVWNRYARDTVTTYCEDSARAGLYGRVPISHLQLLDLLGVTRSGPPRENARDAAVSVLQ